MKKNKKNKKNIEGAEERIFIDESDLSVLLKSERWVPKSEAGEPSQEAVSAKVGELVLLPAIDLQKIDIELLTKITSSDIIDRFLRAETHRIVAEEGEVESEIVTEAELQDEDDMVSEELAEVDVEIKAGDKERLTDEMGDLFFALINACRLYGIDPEGALERTNKKFIRRFGYVEEQAERTGRVLKEMSLEEMDGYWNEAKRLENK